MADLEIDAALLRMVREYYLRPEIVDKMFGLSEGREVIRVFRGMQLGKTPGSVQFVGKP